MKGTSTTKAPRTYLEGKEGNYMKGKGEVVLEEEGRHLVEVEEAPCHPRTSRKARRRSEKMERVVDCQRRAVRGPSTS